MTSTPRLVLNSLAAFASALLVAGSLSAQSTQTSQSSPTTQKAAPSSQPAATGDEWAVLETDVGDIVIDLDERNAPKHAANFKKLVRQGWYDGSPFHRVIPGFMAQGGGKWGAGGRPTDVGYKVDAEIVPGLSHLRGTVAAARQGDQFNPERKSSGSQFYICFVPTPHLDGAYSIFGTVVSGMDAVDSLTKGGRGGSVHPDEASNIRRAYMRAATETK